MTDPGPAGTPEPLHVETVDLLRVEVYGDRQAMGRAAARRSAEVIRNALAGSEGARVMFASAPSQNELLEGLTRSGLEWARVEAFHMDEYLGVDRESPQAFSRYLQDHLFRVVRAGRFNAL
ncbi:MAG: hypothetical protein J2P58_14820, partial [Acidimicrobiaceae bacterium]|nr:hypothetical protein [Acidimicrobiaceae bacterium]